MKITDSYDDCNLEHKRFLAKEARKFEDYTKEELRELAGAMVAYGIKLCEIPRVVRTYTDNPFGKYFYI